MKNLQHQENNELVYKFQNGDDLAFTKLFDGNKGLVHSVLNRYTTNANLRYVDKENFESAAYLGFIKASKSYKEDGGRKFSSYCTRLMEMEMLKELQFVDHCGRKEGIANTDSYNAPTKAGDGEIEMIESLNIGEKDSYFEGEFSSTAKAIEYALLDNQTAFKDYIVHVVCGDYSQTDIVEMFGVSKQVVNYQVKTFKKKVQEYLVNHRLSGIELMG